MAVTFLEPGGDATFNVAARVSNGGFWRTIGGTAPVVATDFVHGTHVKSIKFATTNVTSFATTPNGRLSNTGSRVSGYFYLNSLPATANTDIFGMQAVNDGTIYISIQVTTAGALQLWSGTTTGQLGSDGPKIVAGRWYRISVSCTVASDTVNEFRVYLDNDLVISVSNASLIVGTTLNAVYIGRQKTGGTVDFRASDIYVEQDSSLNNTGDIWVTAKRPNANGTANNFNTQIGSGGSGYGSGHSPQVNERALSNTNGWSKIGAGSAVTEEYNIENKATGDIDISSATIVDWSAWVDIKSLSAETIQIITDGVNNAQAITSTETTYTQVVGSSVYPSGTGADVGVITDTSLTTVSLYECGVMVAFIPAPNHNLTLLGVGI